MSQVFNNMDIASKPVVPMQNTQNVGIQVQTALPASNVKGDTVEISQPKQKESIFKKISRGISNIKKSFVSFGEHTKGGIAGVYKGALAGSLVYTAGQIINHIKKGGKKIPNVLLGSLVAVGTLGLNIWKGHLNANEKMSAIDHRWTGHQ